MFIATGMIGQRRGVRTTRWSVDEARRDRHTSEYASHTQLQCNATGRAGEIDNGARNRSGDEITIKHVALCSTTVANSTHKQLAQQGRHASINIPISIRATGMPVIGEDQPATHSPPWPVSYRRQESRGSRAQT